MNEQTPRRRTSPVIRSLAALGLIVAFLAVAAYVRPRDTTADPMSARELRSIRAPIQKTSGTSLGWLESPEYRVQIFATDDGPRYDVYDAEGVLVAAGLTAEELHQIDPTLDPTNSVGTPLGLVTDDDL